MNCQKCGGKTEIVDTEKYSMFVWRRRRCMSCGFRMSTHENFVDDGKTYRTKTKRAPKPKDEQPKPKAAPKPKAESAPKIEPLPVRNVRKQIEDLREYLEHRKRDSENDQNTY